MIVVDMFGDDEEDDDDVNGYGSDVVLVDVYVATVS